MPSKRPSKRTAVKKTETDETAEIEVDEAAEDTDAGATGPTRGKPSYGLTKVGDDLPEDDKGSRRSIYFDLLSEVKADEDSHGEWFQIAEFSTRGGAKDAKKALLSGDRAMPSGEWEFEARRFTVEGKRISRLYARFLGD